MLYLDSVSQGLSEEDMLNLQTAVVDESVSSSHPWMASDAQPDACVEDDILDVRDVLARVQGSINTFEDGPPKVHVAIVRDNAEYFAIAWQLSLQHNATLRRHRREPTPPAPYHGGRLGRVCCTRRCPSSRPARSSAILATLERDDCARHIISVQNGV